MSCAVTNQYFCGKGSISLVEANIRKILIIHAPTPSANDPSDDISTCWHALYSPNTRYITIWNLFG